MRSALFIYTSRAGPSVQSAVAVPAGLVFGRVGAGVVLVLLQVVPVFDQLARLELMGGN